MREKSPLNDENAPQVKSYDEVLRFGKHAGKSVEEVMIIDKKWLVWCRDNYSFNSAQGKLKQFNAAFVDVGVMTNHYHLYKYIVYHRETPSLKLTFYSAVIVVNALQKQQILQVFDPLLGATSVRLDQIVFEKQE